MLSDPRVPTSNRPGNRITVQCVYNKLKERQSDNIYFPHYQIGARSLRMEYSKAEHVIIRAKDKDHDSVEKPPLPPRVLMLSNVHETVSRSGFKALHTFS